MSLQFRSMIDARPAAAKKPAAKKREAKASAKAKTEAKLIDRRKPKPAKAKATQKPAAISWDGVIDRINARAEIPDAEAGPAVSVVAPHEVALTELPRGKARPWGEILAKVGAGSE